jgi:hypothetical protein
LKIPTISIFHWRAVSDVVSGETSGADSNIFDREIFLKELANPW